MTSFSFRFRPLFLFRVGIFGGSTSRSGRSSLSLGWRGAREGRALSRYRILRPELSKVHPEHSRKLTLLESRRKLAGGGHLVTSRAVRSVASGQPGQDGPLGHLQPLGHGRDAGQGGGQPADVRLHVGEQLLELVEHFMEDGVGGFITRQTLLGQVLVRLGQTFHLKK